MAIDKTMETVFIVLTAVIVLGVFVQAVFVLSTFIVLRKMQKKAQIAVEDLRIHLFPALGALRAMLEDLSPKLKILSTNVVETSGKVRAMAEEIGGVVADVSSRARAQAAHVDDIVEGTLDHLVRAGDTIQQGFSVPMRHIAGVVSGIRAGVNVMREKRTPEPSNDGASDLFI
jgi:methyl-accepting chemotaxis protein